MSDITFAQDAFNEYLYWQTQDKKTLKKSMHLRRILCISKAWMSLTIR